MFSLKLVNIDDCVLQIYESRGKHLATVQGAWNQSDCFCLWMLDRYKSFSMYKY